MPVEVFELALHLLCNQQLVRNPFLISKLVEVLCACCPAVPLSSQGPPVQLFLNLLNNRVLLDPRNDLIASLVVFWSNVELTGESNGNITAISTYSIRVQYTEVHEHELCCLFQIRLSHGVLRQIQHPGEPRGHLQGHLALPPVSQASNDRIRSVLICYISSISFSNLLD